MFRDVARARVCCSAAAQRQIESVVFGRQRRRLLVADGGEGSGFPCDADASDAGRGGGGGGGRRDGRGVLAPPALVVQFAGAARRFRVPETGRI